MNHIIECVKRYPELYNPNHADFKDQLRKPKLWTKIADELGLEDGETARSKWKNIRYSYVKYLRNGTILSKASNTRYKYWPWAEQMEFMRPYIANKWPELAGSYRVDPLSEEKGGMAAHITDDNGTSEPKRKRSTGSSSPSVSQKFGGYLHDSDADDLLFLSYSKTLKTFSKRRQMVVKSKIAKVMLNAEMQQAEEDEQEEVKFEPAKVMLNEEMHQAEEDEQVEVKFEPAEIYDGGTTMMRL